ncbi:hypothetical protein T4D_11249, partial [Trichinella pseudospiralis]
LPLLRQHYSVVPNSAFQPAVEYEQADVSTADINKIFLLFMFFSLYRTAYGPLYEPGDQIWIQLPLRTKLGAYWDGPYQVQKNWIGTQPYHGTREGEGAQGRQRERRKTR